MDNNKTMLLALELLGQHWEGDKLPQEILLSDGNVKLIMNIRTLVDDTGAGLTLETLRSEAPTFVEQVQHAIMRDFEELNPHGADY